MANPEVTKEIPERVALTKESGALLHPGRPVEFADIRAAIDILVGQIGIQALLHEVTKLAVESRLFSESMDAAALDAAQADATLEAQAVDVTMIESPALLT